MHHKLHTPDSLGRGVGSRSNVPWRELLGEGADIGPVACACEGNGVCCGGTEGGELFGSQDGRHDHKAVSFEGVEVGCLGHDVLCS